MLRCNFIGINESKEVIKINQDWIEEFNLQNLIQCELFKKYKKMLVILRLSILRILITQHRRDL
ncbi:hypothetical protein [Helicobacter apodemus]|uniref:hypothetical protein n=1 Tax=Helicobacter apodemus TaxID=135569 RepID=UPI0018834F4A|nr:hypothetical protein [Helicobacter apodemus]